ncbi:hypothetical protein [Roseicyclus persicicus]|uniref:Uncharacterized protein n=1 Tax=Roseicyclus persicicus TaxID=2650661 RepID=A0A7X6JXS7_9RHOB|nr:hypothetical protein [Roseibacterium persicicum]NKX45867.1 hypothetical protein [Roseibacterium persicicum]
MAAGGCPGAGDAADGIWLTFPHRVSLMRARPGGLVADWAFTRDGTPASVVRRHPVGLLRDSWAMDDGDMAPGSEQRFAYSGDIPTPAPGVVFDAVEILTDLDGREVRRGAIALRVGAARDVLVGGCAYAALPVTVTRTPQGGVRGDRDSLLVLRELGLPVWLGFSGLDDPPQDMLPLAIAARPPWPGWRHPVRPPELP